MLSVIRLNVVILSVVAPHLIHFFIIFQEIDGRRGTRRYCLTEETTFIHSEASKSGKGQVPQQTEVVVHQTQFLTPNYGMSKTIPLKSVNSINNNAENKKADIDNNTDNIKVDESSAA
jgi:hypothetical protein